MEQYYNQAGFEKDPASNPYSPYQPHSNPGTNYSFPPARHAVSQPRTWTRKPSKTQLVKNYIRRNFGVIALAIILAGIIIGAIVVVDGWASSSSTIQVVNQPPGAAQVAKDLNCTKFKDTGPAQAGGAVDTGYCFIGGKKYAIDTFASQDARDAWLKIAMPMGVNPKWESNTSVTYPSVTK